MKSFPTKLVPQNKNKFSEYRFNRELCYLRRKIVEYMYSGDEKGFDLTTPLHNRMNNEYTINPLLIEKIRNELHSLGWETTLCYGNTVLYIYDKKNPPPELYNCSIIE